MISPDSPAYIIAFTLKYPFKQSPRGYRGSIEIRYDVKSFTPIHREKAQRRRSQGTAMTSQTCLSWRTTRFSANPITGLDIPAQAYITCHFVFHQSRAISRGGVDVRCTALLLPRMSQMRQQQAASRIFTHLLRIPAPLQPPDTLVNLPL